MSLVHVHNHSDFSALDGLSTCDDIARRTADLNQSAVAITDHGECSGHFQFQRECDSQGVKPIFGIETYFVPDRKERPGTGDKEAQKRLRENRHLVLLARDDQGLRDMWALSTDAHLNGFYYRPRCDFESLERYGSHLIATTACLGGIISRQILDNELSPAIQRLNRFKDIFPGHLYLEIQGNTLPEQIRLNRALVEISDILSIPLVAASDAHYPSPAEKELHRLWMSCQTSPVNDEYWHYIGMQSESDMRTALAYLDSAKADEAIRNTSLIAEQCDARISGHAEAPVFTDSHEHDATMLLDLALAGWDRIRPQGSRQAYRDRVEREWLLVADKQLAGCYLMVHDVVNWARSQGILVGPGRGSAAGSLLSYLLGITSIDPLRAGLLFERFLTPGRMSMPDFDMDFPSSARAAVQDYVISKYGSAHVVRVGTHMRYHAKGILNKLFSVMGTGADDAPRISAIIDEAESHTAGLGLPYEELMEETATEMAPFTERYPAVFEAAGRLAGRLYAYGKHPAALVISASRDLVSTLPMRADDKGQMVSQWDFRDLESMGLLKIDFLTIRTLDSIQEAIRLVAARTGQPPDPIQWDAELDDPQVWDDIDSGHTLGLFQIETSLGQQACRRMKPRAIADLSDLIALVRPGPRNSGMAESYYRRREGLEEITYPHPLLEPILKDRHGIMLYQEDVLATCRELAGYDGAEADEVRKILGKKKVDLIGPAGEKFIARCHEHSGIPHEEAAALWKDMETFSKYGFNLSHSYSYATLSFWTGWLKCHYPVEMTAAILSTLKDKDRMAAFAIDGRRMGVAILPPDVSLSGAGFQVEGLAIRYGLSSIKGAGQVAIRSITAAQPYTSLDDFLKRSGADAGVVYALAQAGALDSLAPSRRALVSQLEADRSGDATRCVHKDDAITSAPNKLPCAFDWDSEPPPPPRYGKTGRQLKVIPLKPPARCTRACRHYTPPALSFAGIPEYTPDALWRLENDVYGTWMSPAVFAQLDAIQPGLRASARDVSLMLLNAPPGLYHVPMVYDGSRSAITRRGSIMWWTSLATEVSSISAATFAPRSDEDPDVPALLRVLRRGTLILAGLARESYRSPSGQHRLSWRLDSVSLLR